ncbi:olfactory receptor 7E24-like [Mesocricetus auratus]|uniref:Olfactory receptor 7E24-like n=1 Tax=Mesocricetus auratus TaxID=10036 RepID=A0ABM2WWH7_MESAU|nr:olfactory receptor 7E24-like [Mesocricetus auratus]
MYILALFGNLLIILTVSSDSHLHTPMYFFLSNLSMIDIGFISTTVPKVIVDIQTHYPVISCVGCLTQMSLLIIFGCMDNMLLAVMAYDRFVAICHPLYYKIIMNPTRCGVLILGSYLSIVCLFYGTGIGVYFSSFLSHSPRSTAVASVMYTVVTPMLNPFIYSLRNNNIKNALRKILAEHSNNWHSL